MAGNDRWIQDALDEWLSDTPGTGPTEDKGWPAPTGYFKSPWRGGEAAAAPSSQPPAASAAPAAPGSGRAAIAARYEEDRAALRTAMTGFTARLLYAFPSVPAMTIADIAAAAGWIAEMERQVMEAALWAVLHKGDGRPELSREVDAALAELAQLKQAYQLQRGRIEQRQAAEIAAINRDTQAFVREQEEKRRVLAEETNDYIEKLRIEGEEKQRILRDRQYREFMRYLRGEEVIRVEIEREF